jgi:4-aminobutyrate aminotransferase
VATTQRTETDRILAARDRYVARGIATPKLVVARAAGATIEDVDGRIYVDFAGGLGCQNTGHGLPSAVAAMQEQIDRYLHPCFMVGTYEPYVELCRRLAELSPCRGAEQRSLLLNSGAEAVENAVKIARAATGRPAVIAFDNAFHGRTLLTMTLTSKVAYRKGFGPFAPEVYRAPAPYAYRGITADHAVAGLELLFKQAVDPGSVACVILEPVQGEGGFIPMPADFLVRLREVCDRHGIVYVDDEVQSGIGRTGPVWAIEHAGVEPDLLLSGKSLGGGLPLAGVTGNAELMDAVEPGGLGGTFGGNPVACAAGIAVLDEVATQAFRARADEIGARLRERLDAIAARIPQVGDVRGLGPMLALELVRDPATRDPAPELALATTTGARERGLILLSCGLYGNVVRILVPLVASDDELDRGLDILEESLVDACNGN